MLVWGIALVIPLSLVMGCGSTPSPSKPPGATGQKDASGKPNVKSAID